MGSENVKYKINVHRKLKTLTTYLKLLVPTFEKLEIFFFLNWFMHPVAGRWPPIGAETCREKMHTKLCTNICCVRRFLYLLIEIFCLYVYSSYNACASVTAFINVPLIVYDLSPLIS
jgi:hypothetical protein